MKSLTPQELKSLRIFSLVIVVLTLAGTIIPSLSQYLNNNYNKVIIERVIDGDTIEDLHGVRYRLIGIDTPEKGRQHYKDSKEALALLLCTFCDKSSGHPKKINSSISQNAYYLSNKNPFGDTGVRDTYVKSIYSMLGISLFIHRG